MMADDVQHDTPDAPIQRNASSMLVFVLHASLDTAAECEVKIVRSRECYSPASPNPPCVQRQTPEGAKANPRGRKGKPPWARVSCLPARRTTRNANSFLSSWTMTTPVAPAAASPAANTKPPAGCGIGFLAAMARGCLC